MKRITTGVVAGLIFGLLDVLLMVPLAMPDKITAMAGSFVNRFAIGFLIANTDISVPSWLKGLIIGFVLSLTDAIITHTYVPILGVGIVGGVIIGVVNGKQSLRK